MQAFAIQKEEISVGRIKEITELAISIIYCIRQIAFEKSDSPEVCREFKLGLSIVETTTVRVGCDFN